MVGTILLVIITVCCKLFLLFSAVLILENIWVCTYCRLHKRILVFMYKSRPLKKKFKCVNSKQMYINVDTYTSMRIWSSPGIRLDHSRHGCFRSTEQWSVPARTQRQWVLFPSGFYFLVCRLKSLRLQPNLTIKCISTFSNVTFKTVRDSKSNYNEIFYILRLNVDPIDNINYNSIHWLNNVTGNVPKVYRYYLLSINVGTYPPTYLRFISIIDVSCIDNRSLKSDYQSWLNQK